MNELLAALVVYYLILGMGWFCIVVIHEQARLFPDCKTHHWAVTFLMNVLLWPLAYALATRNWRRKPCAKQDSGCPTCRHRADWRVFLISGLSFYSIIGLLGLFVSRQGKTLDLVDAVILNTVVFPLCWFFANKYWGKPKVQ